MYVRFESDCVKTNKELVGKKIVIEERNVLLEYMIYVYVLYIKIDSEWNELYE